jgi:hypothetical protein
MVSSPERHGEQAHHFLEEVPALETEENEGPPPLGIAGSEIKEDLGD